MTDFKGDHSSEEDTESDLAVMIARIGRRTVDWTGVRLRTNERSTDVNVLTGSAPLRTVGTLLFNTRNIEIFPSLLSLS